MAKKYPIREINDNSPPPVSNISIEISFFYTEQIVNLISFHTI